MADQHARRIADLENQVTALEKRCDNYAEALIWLRDRYQTLYIACKASHNLMSDKHRRQFDKEEARLLEIENNKRKEVNESKFNNRYK